MASPSSSPRAWLHPREIVTVTRDAIQSYGGHRTGRMAAALAYYMIFSLFPILLLLLALIGFLLDAGWSVALDTREYLLQVTSDLLPAVGDLVSNAIESVQASRTASGVIGLLGLLWSASNTFNHLHIALDQIWGLNGQAGFRLTVKRRAVSIAIVLSMGLVLIVVQLLKSTSYLLVTLTDQVPGGALLHSVVTWLFPFLAAIVVFGLLYKTLPSLPLSWHDVWPGAVLAGIGWELLKWLFALYAVSFANWQDVYGPVASVIGLLTWLYFSFTVILFGAEFAASYSRHLHREPQEKFEIGVAQELTEPQDDPATDAPDGEPDVVMEKPASEPDAAKLRPSFTAGTIAGVAGVLAAAGIGIGMLIGNTRRTKDSKR